MPGVKPTDLNARVGLVRTAKRPARLSAGTSSKTLEPQTHCFHRVLGIAGHVLLLGGKMKKRGLTAGGGMVLGMIFGIAMGHMVVGMVIGLLFGAAVAAALRGAARHPSS
jgi:hypothetical protein